MEAPSVSGSCMSSPQGGREGDILEGGDLDSSLF